MSPQRCPRLWRHAEGHGRAQIGRVRLPDQMEGNARAAQPLGQGQQLSLVAHAERDGTGLRGNGFADRGARGVDRLGNLHPEGEVFPKDDVVVQRLGVNAWEADYRVRR